MVAVCNSNNYTEQNCNSVKLNTVLYLVLLNCFVLFLRFDTSFCYLDEIFVLFWL